MKQEHVLILTTEQIAALTTPAQNAALVGLVPPLFLPGLGEALLLSGEAVGVPHDAETDAMNEEIEKLRARLERRG